jgi:dTMP kinase
VTRKQRARFITLEGGEGSGKSTQIARLAGALERNGIAFITTREPGGSAAGERIRKLLVEGEPGSLGSTAEVLLHYAARAEHLTHTLHPALRRGAWVISDRFADSTLAYQGYGHKVDRRTIDALYRIVCGKFKPDLTLILDVPVKLGLARAASRAGAENRYERMDTSFHERVRRGFLKIARKDRKRCAVVDASQPADEVTLEILEIIAKKFGMTFA